MAQSFFKMRPYLFSTTLSHTFTSRPGLGIFLRECQQIANFQNPKSKQTPNHTVDSDQFLAAH